MPIGGGAEQYDAATNRDEGDEDSPLSGIPRDAYRNPPPRGRSASGNASDSRGPASPS